MMMVVVFFSQVFTETYLWLGGEEKRDGQPSSNQAVFHEVSPDETTAVRILCCITGWLQPAAKH